MERHRRLLVVILLSLAPLAGALYESQQKPAFYDAAPGTTKVQSANASGALNKLEIKGRAPKTGYQRAEFGDDWADVGGCDMRNHILKRDLTNAIIDQQTNCKVLSGELNDPYTGTIINFMRGAQTSDKVQIDHIVALSDSWQKGAQGFGAQKRLEFANDPLNLLAVDGDANQKKSDSDAASWLPPNKDYRCRYVARQIAVKEKYSLWVTKAEFDAMRRILSNCPNQVLPIVSPKK